MGAILQPTHAMGAWTVETRRESAYVHGDTLVRRGHGFAIPLADRPQVLAAVDQIMASNAYAEWNATATTDNRRLWNASSHGDRLRLAGPGIFYGGYDGPWSAGSVELRYEGLADLRQVLEQAGA